jgi:leader peptidase (prepilin peptidase)/N-methyltransferase
MLILIIKGGLFAFLLVLAAVWDIRKCEIPNTISLLIMITGLLQLILGMHFQDLL